MPDEFDDPAPDDDSVLDDDEQQAKVEQTDNGPHAGDPDQAGVPQTAEPLQ